MKAGISLLDHMNCPVDGSPFPLMQDSSGHPIIPAKGDFFHKGAWDYMVEGVYWHYEDESVTVVATEIYGQRAIHMMRPNTNPEHIASIDRRPHSKACGFSLHEHGSACHHSCPTCEGLTINRGV